MYVIMNKSFDRVYLNGYADTPLQGMLSGKNKYDNEDVKVFQSYFKAWLFTTFKCGGSIVPLKLFEQLVAKPYATTYCTTKERIIVMKEFNQELLQSLVALKKLRGNVYTNKLPPCGLCDYITRLDDLFTGDWEEYLEDLFSGWKYHSGCSVFIVPKSKGNLSQEDAGKTYMRSNSKEMWFGSEYSDLRWDLVDHCITKLQDELS